MRLLPSGLVVHRWCPAAVPGRLIPVGSSRDHHLTHLALPETVEAFGRMQDAAAQDHVSFQVVWAYRSPELQAQQFREAQARHGMRDGIKWLAPPGFSEHQTGWALDIGDSHDPQADDNPLFERTPA